MIKYIILGILLLTLSILILFISKVVFTIMTICVIIYFLISKYKGNNIMFTFLKHFGKSKAKSAGNETRKLIARLDKDGFSDAVLGEMQEQLESIGTELSKARKRASKEKQEYIDIQKLYDQRLAAAESIKTMVDNGDTSKEPSLLKLIDLLETTAISVETEKSEADFWENHLSVIQNRYDTASNDLRSARSKISQGTAKMEQAEIKQEQAKIKAEEMKRASGLSSSMSSLDAALSAMDDAVEKAEVKTDAAEISLEAFKTSRIEEDDVIKAAMADASGESSTLSISDRLSALK